MIEEDVTSKEKQKEFQERTGKGFGEVTRFIKGLTTLLLKEVREAEEEGDVVRMAAAYASFRTYHEEFKEDVKSINAAFRYYCEVTLPRAIELSPLDNVPLSEHGRVIGRQVENRTSVKKDNKGAAIDYLRADAEAIYALQIGNTNDAVSALIRGGHKDLAEKIHEDPTTQGEVLEHLEATTPGLENLVVDYIHPQTLNSTAKELAKKGIELPEEIFSSYKHYSTTWRKIATK